MFNIRITTKFQSNCPFRITNNPETLFKMHKIGFNVFKKHWAETRNKTPSFLDVSRHRSNSENHPQGSWQSEERLEHSWCQGFQTSMEKRIYSLVKVWCYSWHYYWKDTEQQRLCSLITFTQQTVTCKTVTFTEFFLTWNWALMRLKWSVSV